MSIKASEVGYGAATVDETLARSGITVGVSAGVQELRLFFTKPVVKKGRVAIERISCRNRTIFKQRLANVWLLWMQMPADVG